MYKKVDRKNEHKTREEMLPDIRSTINEMSDEQLLDLMDLATLAQWIMKPVRCNQCQRFKESGLICPHEQGITIDSITWDGDDDEE